MLVTKNKWAERFPATRRTQDELRVPRPALIHGQFRSRMASRAKLATAEMLPPAEPPERPCINPG